MKKTWIFAVMMSLAAFGVACGGGGGGDSDEHMDEHEGGENVDMSAFEGPVSGDATAGAEVFANFCAGCHPNGQAGVGDDLTTSHDSPAEARYIIRNGESRMPAFDESQIPDADLENLLAHLQTYGMFQ